MDKQQAMDDYLRWKSLVPVLYDWFTNHSLSWPSLGCRWGPILDQGEDCLRQRCYISEQTTGKFPNTLVAANCEVMKTRVDAGGDSMSEFDEEARSPFIRKHKVIIHPGEVNRIRELPQNSNIVATHTDSTEVLIWNMEKQPNRAPATGAAPSRPDLVLTGHSENAEYALALSPALPLVLSGGQDKRVLLWSIEDHVTSLAESAHKSAGSRQTWNSGGNAMVSGKPAGPERIAPRSVCVGHTATVEDVQFRPTSTQEFCSVGDDRCLIFWDVRVGVEPVVKVQKAHKDDVHCIDWNGHDENLVLTGSADTFVRLFDRRKLQSDGRGLPIETFDGHKDAVLCVQWCPTKMSVFASSADDGLLNLWDFDKVTKKEEGRGSRKGSSLAPSGLFFKHIGHREKVVDFHWNPHEPWTILSVDCQYSGGGGSILQIWRISDLIYRPTEEVLAELKTHQDSILSGTKHT